MASNAPAKCCTVGVKHEGKPSGKIETISGVETYIAQPTGSNVKKNTAILFLTDVLGHEFPNAQLLADQYAANGYLTIIPNIMHGDPVSVNPPTGFEIMKWFGGEAPHGKTPHTPDTVFPIVASSVAYLRDTLGVKKVGSVGYCYGAKYVTVAMGEGKVDVGFVAHPSFVEESELAAIKGPYSIAAAETDQIFPADKRHKSEEILKETKQPYQIALYSGTTHGFAVRGDLTNPAIKFGMEQAFLQAVQWFDQWLK